MVSRSVDFEHVKTQVGWEGLLHHFGLWEGSTQRQTAKGVELRLHCPFHEDRQPSLSINLDTGLFNCFGCAAKGYDLYDFVVLKWGIGVGDKKQDRYQAACLVAEWFGIESSRPKKRRAKKQQPKTEAVSDAAAPAVEDLEAPAGQDGDEPVNPPLEFPYTELDHAYPYLIERGLTDKTIATFGIGYYPGKGLMRGRVAIPIHNETGKLVAYAGRWPGDSGWPEGEERYKLPAKFRKSLVVFNLHQVLEKGTDRVVVTEGFFDAMRIVQAGFPAVALMGSSLSDEQATLLCQHFRYLTLLMDGDEAGQRVTEECLSMLGRRRYVRAVELPEGLQPDRLSNEEIRAALRYA